MNQTRSLKHLVERFFAQLPAEASYNQYVLRHNTIYRTLTHTGKLRNFARLVEGKVQIEYCLDNRKDIARLLPLFCAHVAHKYKDIHFVKRLYSEIDPTSLDHDDAYYLDLHFVLEQTVLNPELFAMFKSVGYNIKWSLYLYASYYNITTTFFDILEEEIIGRTFQRKQYSIYGQPGKMLVGDDVKEYLLGFAREVKLHLLIGEEFDIEDLT